MTHDFVIPVGPQSPAMKEPMLIKLKVTGFRVEEAELRLGYTHKGIEKLLEGQNIDQAMYLTSRICGICSIAHENAYIRTIEGMMKIKAGERVELIRTIMFELERIASHMLWAGFMMHEIGYETMFQFLWRDRESVLDLFEEIAGNRIHKNINKIQTLRFDITGEHEKKILAAVDAIEPKIRDYLNEIEKSHAIGTRLRNVGVISKKTAEEWCLVGPNARASGVRSIDVRKIDPYHAYADMKFSEVTGKSGDSMERTRMRLLEIFESIKIIHQAVEKLPKKGIMKFKPLHSMEDAEGTGRVEAARGELFYYLNVKNNMISRAKIRTPTLNYIKILELLLPNNKMGDVPVIIASVDPCFSCMERILVSKKVGSAYDDKWMKEDEFKKKYGETNE